MWKKLPAPITPTLDKGHCKVMVADGVRNSGKAAEKMPDLKDWRENGESGVRGRHLTIDICVL
jgi:hypothetical protein